MSAVQKGFAVVVAADEQSGIGRAGTLPWRLPGEMAYFKRLTSEAPTGRSNAVIMGRKTYDSIAPRFRPLAGRLNVVLTRERAYAPEGALAAYGLDEALAQLDARTDLGQLFVIGGGELYRLALVHPRCTRVYLTRVHERFDCDVHLPPLGSTFQKVASDGPHREGALSYTFEVHERIP